MGYSLGIGLTNACDLDCAHCYRETTRIDYVTLDQVRAICEAIPVSSVGMGTGENALHPQFSEIVAYLAGLNIRLSIASNGYSLTAMSEGTLRSFSDVELSVDFADETAQDAFRGLGNWALVHQAIERCQRHGVEVSLLATLMSDNFDQMERLVRLARRLNANLRVNAYQPVRGDSFMPDYGQFWEGYRRLFDEGEVIACSEPVVRAAMGLEGTGSPCGRNSIRVNPRGQVIPCVYWPIGPDDGPRVEDLARLGAAVLEAPEFRRARHEPANVECGCRGGCAARRALLGDLDAHDYYCPWVRGESLTLDWRAAPAKDLTRIGNVCTTLVL